LSGAAVGAACAETSLTDRRRTMVQSNDFAVRFMFSITQWLRQGNSDRKKAADERRPLLDDSCRV
jgi:hypothetical protein